MQAEALVPQPAYVSVMFYGFTVTDHLTLDLPRFNLLAAELFF